MDTFFFRMINDRWKCAFFDAVLPAFSDKDYIVIPGLVAIGALLYFGRRHVRTCVLALALALALSDVGVEKVLKNVFQRPRPYASL